MLSESELQRLIASLDQAAATFNAHSGSLTAREVSLRSMLTVLRRQALEELEQRRRGHDDPLPHR